jgi:hypothetical protein
MRRWTFNLPFYDSYYARIYLLLVGSYYLVSQVHVICLERQEILIIDWNQHWNYNSGT